MLIDEDIGHLDSIASALGVALGCGKDDQGPLVYVGSRNCEARCGCRTLREAISILAAEVDEGDETTSRESRQSVVLSPRGGDAAARRYSGPARDSWWLTGSD